MNTGFFLTVAGRLDAAARARLARLMVVDPVTRRSEFDRLKDVAKAPPAPAKPPRSGR